MVQVGVDVIVGDRSWVHRRAGVLATVGRGEEALQGDGWKQGQRTGRRHPIGNRKNEEGKEKTCESPSMLYLQRPALLCTRFHLCLDQILDKTSAVPQVSSKLRTQRLQAKSIFRVKSVRS